MAEMRYFRTTRMIFQRLAVPSMEFEDTWGHYLEVNKMA
jgi:hypothetical protein